ncbi:MAG: hypothetical protein AAGG01_14900, partial [Planctomycetota bacterium]
MQGQRAILALALATACAGLLWLATSGDGMRASFVAPGNAEVSRGVSASADPSLEDVERVDDLAASVREAASGDGVRPTSSSGVALAAKGLELPRRLRWIDSRSGEPRAYEEFLLEDAAGESFLGESDVEGWVDVPRTLTPGPVTVTLLRRNVRPRALFGEAEGPLEGLFLAAGFGGGAPDECIWGVTLARHVPVRFRVETSAADIDLEDVDVWLACAGSDPLEQTFVKYDVRVYPAWLGDRAQKLRGATHGFRLPVSSDPIAGRLSAGLQGAQWHPPCWLQASAGKRLAQRRAVFVAVEKGRILVSDTKEAVLPRVGEEPLSITLREQSGQLAHPFLTSYYQSEAYFQQAEIDRVESEKARPVFQVEGTIRSNSGRYQGEVAIRANPADRNAEGGYDLRQQWITAKWQEVAPGHFEAPFTLDR